jgi:hypothetical protein
MLNRNETCPSCFESKTKGYVYAVITAIACPCHLPLLGIYLGTSAAGAFFAQYFILLVVLLGILSLVSFAAAVRVLL